MKKFLYWLPRVIAISYPVILIGEPIFSSVTTGVFNLRAFGMMLSLAAVLFAVVYAAWRWPKVGGVVVTLLGVMTVIGASTSSIGVDWLGLLSGGVPLTIAGILFLVEGFRPLGRGQTA